MEKRLECNLTENHPPRPSYPFLGSFLPDPHSLHRNLAGGNSHYLVGGSYEDVLVARPPEPSLSHPSLTALESRVVILKREFSLLRSLLPLAMAVSNPGTESGKVSDTYLETNHKSQIISSSDLFCSVKDLNDKVDPDAPIGHRLTAEELLKTNTHQHAPERNNCNGKVAVQKVAIRFQLLNIMTHTIGCTM